MNVKVSGIIDTLSGCDAAKCLCKPCMQHLNICCGNSKPLLLVSKIFPLSITQRFKKENF